MITIVVTALFVATVGWSTFFRLTQKGQEAEEEGTAGCRVISRQTGYAPVSGGPLLYSVAHLPLDNLPLDSQVSLSYCLVLRRQSPELHFLSRWIYNWVINIHTVTILELFSSFLPCLFKDLLSSSSGNMAISTIQTNPATIQQITAINFAIAI